MRDARCATRDARWLVTAGATAGVITVVGREGEVAVGEVEGDGPLDAEQDFGAVVAMLREAVAGVRRPGRRGQSLGGKGGRRHGSGVPGHRYRPISLEYSGK